MEYVVVVGPQGRDVYLDGQRAGTTNETLMVEAGVHTFDLGEPHDYQPPSRTELVDDTTPIAPKVLRFRVRGTGTGGGQP